MSARFILLASLLIVGCKSAPIPKVAAASNISNLFSNSHLQVEPMPYNKDDVRLGIADGVWELSDGNHPVDPEEASILCIKRDRTCTIETVKLELSNQKIRIESPQSEDYKISEWNSETITATHAPNIVDKCHHSVLMMTFSTSEVTMTDIPTHADGCQFSTMTNTWHLVRAAYYIDTSQPKA